MCWSGTELGWLGAQLGRVQGLRAHIAGATGYRRAGIAFTAGAVSVLAYAPFFLWPILFVTFPALVWLVDGAGSVARSTRQAALDGWWFGFGFFLLGLFWIGEAFLVEAEKFAWLMPFAVTLLPAGLALFWAAATALARQLWVPGLGRLIMLALALGGAEWLRGHVLTGFPWNAIGYALTAPDVLMQSAGLLGIYGLTLWAVVIFAAPLVALGDAKSCAASGKVMLSGLVLGAVPLMVLWLYGAHRLAQPDAPFVEGVRLRIVQPSIPQREKWRPENQGWVFQEHLELSLRDESGQIDHLKGVTHLIWPEAAMPFLPLEHPEALEAIGNLLPPGVFLLSGGLRREPTEDATGWRAYNGILVFDDTGQLVQSYDKTHLVPFGEYLPFQPVLERIGLEQLTRMRGGFSTGPEPRPMLSVPGLPPAGGLICYEAIFPGVGAASVRRPALFVNVTNDGWFGETTGPQQHFHQTRVRAVEEGVPIVRAANNGVSAVIDGKGRVLHRLDLNARGVITARLPGLPRPPPLVLYGNWVPLGNCLLFLLIAALVRGRRLTFVSGSDV